MKLQSLIYETIVAITIFLIIFFVISYTVFQKTSLEDKKIKTILYDLLFSLDSVNQLTENKINEIIKNLNLGIYAILSEEGKIKSKLNFSCVCTEEQLLLLNNLFKDGVDINGRKIYLYFSPTIPSLTEKDFALDGLVVWSCNLDSGSIISLEKFTRYAGILMICDLDASTYNRFQSFFYSVFGLTTNCNNNNNLNVKISKPFFGSNASYKVYKILTKSNYLTSFPENYVISNYLNSSIAVCGIDNILIQENSINGIAGAAANWYNDNIHIWTANFLRNRDLTQFLTSTSDQDLKLKKLLLSYLLTISKKKAQITPKLLLSSIFYVNYYYKEFIEPYLATLSYLTL